MSEGREMDVGGEMDTGREVDTGKEIISDSLEDRIKEDAPLIDIMTMDKEYQATFLREKFNILQIKLSDYQVDQFLKYYEILVEWNKVMNLTAIIDYEEVVVKHFADSLAIVQVIDVNKVHSVIDIGTGAGFPGIPLKILFPEWKITLLDSLNKRVKFLDHVIAELGLKKIDAVHARAEELAKDKRYREKYDLCVSRAVANLASLTEYCMGYVRVQGLFVPYKSGKISEEVLQAKKAIAVMGGELKKKVKFQLLDSDMERSFIIIKKKKVTPKKYPRKAGTPTKSPII